MTPERLILMLRSAGMNYQESKDILEVKFPKADMENVCDKIDGIISERGDLE